jgi:hypothetical protein
MKANSMKDEVNALASAFDAKFGEIYSINSTSNQSRYRYGEDSNIERIEVSGSTMVKPSKPGKYRQRYHTRSDTLSSMQAFSYVLTYCTRR